MILTSFVFNSCVFNFHNVHILSSHPIQYIEIPVLDSCHILKKDKYLQTLKHILSNVYHKICLKRIGNTSNIKALFLCLYGRVFYGA